MNLVNKNEIAKNKWDQHSHVTKVCSFFFIYLSLILSQKRIFSSLFPRFFIQFDWSVQSLRNHRSKFASSIVPRLCTINLWITIFSFDSVARIQENQWFHYLTFCLSLFASLLTAPEHVGIIGPHERVQG